MKNHSLFLVFVLFLISTNYYLLNTKYGQDLRVGGQVQSANTVSFPTKVSAYIGYAGQYRFTLFGYASPQALVTIDGMGIYDQTYADSQGYFQFNNQFSPFSPREACLTAQDQLGRLSQPTCLAPFPTRYNVTIGPVILPPTLSLDKSDYYLGDEVILSGQTIPNSNVNLSTFTKDTNTNFLTQLPNLLLNPPSLFRFVKPVEAFTFPQLQTKADKQGNFSVSLPSSQQNSFRLFAQTSYSDSPSGKSTTLNLVILPIWMIILKILYLIFLFFKPRLIEIAIILEVIALLAYIIRRYFQPHMIVRNKSLVLRNRFSLIKSACLPARQGFTQIVLSTPNV